MSASATSCPSSRPMKGRRKPSKWCKRSLPLLLRALAREALKPQSVMMVPKGHRLRRKTKQKVASWLKNAGRYLGRLRKFFPMMIWFVTALSNHSSSLQKELVVEVSPNLHLKIEWQLLTLSETKIRPRLSTSPPFGKLCQTIIR